MRKYTIVDYFGYDLTPQERMRTIREAGFDGVILLWADYFDADYKNFPEYAAKAGLFVENAHAPYRMANSIWTEGEAGETYTDRIIDCICDCSLYGIPTLVMHAINGREPLPDGPNGLARFERILETAEKNGVDLAIENQGSPTYVDFVFGHICSDRLHFCFDSGHEQYYSPERDLLAEYGAKLRALHLHDNDGTEDAYALPFTGKADWNRLRTRLKEVDYKGAIALETLNKGFEYIKDPVEFLGIALERAKRIL